jgi:hypothetical protein
MAIQELVTQATIQGLSVLRNLSACSEIKYSVDKPAIYGWWILTLKATRLRL